MGGTTSQKRVLLLYKDKSVSGIFLVTMIFKYPPIPKPSENNFYQVFFPQCSGILGLT